jgi:hypothetical protein
LLASEEVEIHPIDYLRLAEELRYLWRNGFDKEELWRVYVLACIEGWKGMEPLACCDWQMEDTLDLLLYHPKMFWDWCRESGKTLWGSIFASFIAVCGEEVYWLAKASAQFMRVQRLWNFNPFMVEKKPYAQRKDADTINSNTITMQILDKEENASGPHPFLMVMDEFAQMELELIAKAFFMPQANGLFLLISTPVLGSPTTTIRQDPEFKTVTHTYLNCDWKDPRVVESRKIKGMEWKWRQDQLCEEILPEGAVFKNVFETHTYPAGIENIKQGVDFNGSKNMNILIRVGYFAGQLYILKEEAFQYKIDDNLLQARCLEYPTEVETGGWNTTFAPNLRGVSKLDFAENRGQVKIDRVIDLLAQAIFVNPELCPNILKDLRNAMYSENGKVDTNPLHYLAALMHAVGAKPRYIEPNPISEITRKELRREREFREMRRTVKSSY